MSKLKIIIALLVFGLDRDSVYCSFILYIVFYNVLKSMISVLGQFGDQLKRLKYFITIFISDSRIKYLFQAG